MSQDIPRRPLLIALGAAVGLGVLGGGLYEADLLGHRVHHSGGYGDLLSILSDRDAANRLGAAMLDEEGAFESARVAHELRKHIARRPLAAVLADDLAQEQVVEVQGWILPESLALLCALSAKQG